MTIQTTAKRWAIGLTAGAALALGAGVLAVGAAANAATPTTHSTTHSAVQSTLTAVSGVPLPIDIKVGTAVPLGPVDPASIPGGVTTTAPAN